MRRLKIAGYTLLTLIVLLLAWGFVIEPRLIDTETEVVALPGLPEVWDGRTVAVVADYQIGMWGGNTGTARRITKRLVRERPAVVILAGDFVYGVGKRSGDDLRTVRDIVRPLTEAGLPTFAVLGNHDYSLDAKDAEKDAAQAGRVEEALESMGVRVLRNEALRLEPTTGAGAGRRPADGGDAAADSGRTADTPASADRGLYIVGVGAEWAGEADPERALRGVPQGAARVVVMHNPSSFPKLPPGSAPLAVAGHTHGGQIRIPGTPSWSWIDIVAEGEPHADGWVDASYGSTGNRLYVNRGIGFSAVPVRINSPPEITFFRLQRP